MLSVNPGRFLVGIKSFDWRKSARRAIRFIGAHEKILLAILAIIIVISGGFWYRQFSHNNSDNPIVGGTYVEGVVADKKELSQITTRLTKTGLLTFLADGRLEGQLAEKWTVSDDKSEYRFILRESIDRDEIISVLKDRSDVIGQADIGADLDRDIIVKLALPNPSFPLLMTRPLFDYGPYKLGRSNDQTTVFTRSTKKNAVSAYINKIIIHSYEDESDLQKALRGNRLDGAVTTPSADTPISTTDTPQSLDGGQSAKLSGRDNPTTLDNTTPKNFQQHEVNLNRYYVVLFNSNKTPFREDSLRKALVTGTTVQATPFTIVAADQEPYKTLATSVVAKWQQQGAKVELSLKPLLEITGSIGPSRNFQALLIGIDYGLEMDPFYLWHSSQIRANSNNVTGVNDPTIDALVEKTRTNLNAIERQKSLDELQNTLTTQGVMMIVKRKSLNYYLSNDIHYVQPSLPSADADRFLAAALWSVM